MNYFQHPTEGMVYFLMTAFSLSPLWFSNLHLPTKLQATDVGAGNTDLLEMQQAALRNSDIPFWRLLLSLIHQHDRASSAWQVSRDWMCICWFIAGSWGVFLCIPFDMENPASTWPLLPSPFLVKFNLQTFFFFNPLFHSPFGRYLQEGFCPIHLLWHPCNGGKSKYLCKKNGGKGRCPLAKPCLSYHFLLVSLALNTLLVQ